eukprot:scaffold26725_cov112-Isochrysis_galbana.AAC.3
MIGYELHQLATSNPDARCQVPPGRWSAPYVPMLLLLQATSPIAMIVRTIAHCTLSLECVSLRMFMHLLFGFRLSGWQGGRFTTSSPLWGLGACGRVAQARLARSSKARLQVSATNAANHNLDWQLAPHVIHKLVGGRDPAGLVKPSTGSHSPAVCGVPHQGAARKKPAAELAAARAASPRCRTRPAGRCARRDEGSLRPWTVETAATHSPTQGPGLARTAR